MTIESKSGLKISFHEANLIDFASMTLVNTTGTQLKSDLVPWADGVKVRVKDTFTSSWRTIQIGENAGDLIDSYLVLNLNEPNKLGKPSYVKPYKYFGPVKTKPAITEISLNFRLAISVEFRLFCKS
ncbi:glycoside hydrolase family 97 N-terminal domain-containing protein [Flavobacterium sp. LBUM151]